MPTGTNREDVDRYTYSIAITKSHFKYLRHKKIMPKFSCKPLVTLAFLTGDTPLLFDASDGGSASTGSGTVSTSDDSRVDFGLLSVERVGVSSVTLN